MTTARLDWSTALSPGARVVPVILVAGVPRVLTPAGVRPTTVSVTSGTIDALWWPGTGTLAETLPDASTFDPVADLLDPGEVFEVYERASLLKGDVRVEALTFSLLDTDGAATALLSIREGRTSQLLASEITDTSTSIPLAAVGGFPASGIAAINRETILYGSISGSSLVSSLVRRGRYGSRARSHGAPVEHLPLVSAGGPRHWQGRLTTLWLCALSADGTTLSDPTLVYMGTVGAGVQLKGNLTRWSIPLDHVTESLSRKFDLPPLDLYGFAHFSFSEGSHPLQVGSQTYRAGDPTAWSLQWSTTDSNDNGGWHPSLTSFVAAANRAFDTGSASSGSIDVDSNGKLVVRQRGNNTTPRWFSARAAWDTAVVLDYRVDDDTTPAAWVSYEPAPEACFVLGGRVKIPSATDFARIPATFEWSHTTTAGATGTASLALVADGDRPITGYIRERDAATQTVYVASLGYSPVITKRTATKLGVIARGPSPVPALRAGALGLDALTGQDLYESAVDWDHLEAAFTAAPSSGLPQQREYRFLPGADSFLDVLVDEMRARGMCLAMRFGRITGVRLRSASDVESTVAAIIETDSLVDSNGRELPVEVIDSTEPLASSIVFRVPSGGREPGSVTITDTTFQSEFGDGEAVECKALLAMPESITFDVLGSLAGLYAVAQQILGPLAEPSRAVRLPLTGPLLGLQPGDLVAFTHSRIPTWTGTRGLTAAVCQVQEVRREVFGGKLRATAVLRLQSSASSSYTPEVLVAAGGLTGGSAVVTIDATTGWGAQCHARDTTAAGALSTNAVDGLAVGQAVVLAAVDDRTPIADEPFTVSAVGSTTVTLSGAPSAGMIAAAASQYGVTLRWAAYDTAVAASAATATGWAWIADASAGTLGAGAAAPKRWAA